MLRRTFWIILCCGSLCAVAAATFSAERNVRFPNSETLVPRAARNDRVIDLTETKRNVVTSKPYWGSDASGKGGLDIIWGPTPQMSQAVSWNAETARISFSIPKNEYAYPMTMQMYIRHTYHWRQFNADQKTLTRNPDSSIRQYTAVVDQRCMSSINWVGPFSRDTPLRGKSSETIIPSSARGHGIVGLTDTVTNVTTRTPLWGSILTTGPGAPFMCAVNKASITSYFPYKLEKGFFAYAVLVTTYRRHTFRWAQVNADGAPILRGARGDIRNHTEVVDEYAGSSVGWSAPVPNSVPYPVNHESNS